MWCVPTINPTHWGFHGTIRQVSDSSGTIKLSFKDDTNTKIDLRTFVSQYVPQLKDGSVFRLNHFLFTGILQTMYLSGADYSQWFPVFYGREVLQFSDGGICSLDHVITSWGKKYDIDEVTGKFSKWKFEKDEKDTHPENWPRLQLRTRFLDQAEINETTDDNRPLVIVLPGLAGGSHETIIRSLGEKLSRIGGKRFHVAVLNSRGCARSKVTTKNLFSAFHTDDLRELIAREKARNPNRKIYAVGFSFGASILGNYLGEMGDRSQLQAAVTVSCPWDFILCSEKMKKDYWSKNLFSKTITQFLVRLVKVNMGELEAAEGTVPEVQPSVQNPSLYMCTRSNLERAKTFTQMYQFDGLFTAPSLGFSSADEYYREGSAINRLHNVRTPTLIINSKDDPIVGPDAIPYHEVETNPHLLLLETDLGGHLAYLNDHLDSFLSLQIANFLYKFDEFLR